MKRREFIKLLGGSAITWPLSVRAEQAGRVRRIAVLIHLEKADQDGQNKLSAFQDELQKLGWIVGKNLQIDYRWSISDEERGRLAAADLLKLKPDLIFANATPALRAAQQATSTIPIVFTTVIDPVGQEFVASLAHPGGNTTGFSGVRTFRRRKMAGPAQADRATSYPRGVYVQSAAGSLWGAYFKFRARSGKKACGAVHRGAGL